MDDDYGGRLSLLQQVMDAQAELIKAEQEFGKTVQRAMGAGLDAADVAKAVDLIRRAAER